MQLQCDEGAVGEVYGKGADFEREGFPCVAGTRDGLEKYIAWYGEDQRSAEYPYGRGDGLIQ